MTVSGSLAFQPCELAGLERLLPGLTDHRERWGMPKTPAFPVVRATALHSQKRLDSDLRLIPH